MQHLGGCDGGKQMSDAKPRRAARESVIRKVAAGLPRLVQADGRPLPAPEASSEPAPSVVILAAASMASPSPPVMAQPSPPAMAQPSTPTTPPKDAWYAAIEAQSAWVRGCER